MNSLFPILIALGLIGFAVLQIFRYRDIFHPLCHQSIMVAILLGARVFWLLAGYDEMLPGRDPEDIPHALSKALLFYLLFFALAALIYGYSPSVMPWIQRCSYTFRSYGGATTFASPTRVMAAYSCIGILALGTISFTVSIASFLKDPASERSVFSGNWALFYALNIPVVAAISHYAMRLCGDVRSSRMWLTLFNALLAICGAVLTGFRGFIAMALLPFLALRAHRYRRIEYLLLGVFVAFLVLLSPLMDGFVYGNLWNTLLEGNLSGVVDYYGERYADIIASAYGRYYTLEGTARTLAYLDEGFVAHDNGQLILDFPRILLPTVLVGWKPSVTQEITRTFFANRYGAMSETSAVTSLPAFMYWQLGWPGFLIAALAYGLFLRFWVSVYEDRGIGSSVYIAFTFPYFLMIFVGHIGTLAEFIYLHILLFPLLRLHLKSKEVRTKTSSEPPASSPIPRESPSGVAV